MYKKITRELIHGKTMPGLEETLGRVFKIIKYIEEHEGCSITDIANGLNMNKNTVVKIVKCLVELGIVKKELTGIPRKSIIELTAKGKCLASCLKSE